MPTSTALFLCPAYRMTRRELYAAVTRFDFYGSRFSPLPSRESPVLQIDIPSLLSSFAFVSVLDPDLLYYRDRVVGAVQAGRIPIITSIASFSFSLFSVSPLRVFLPSALFSLRTQRRLPRRWSPLLTASAFLFGLYKTTSASFLSLFGPLFLRPTLPLPPI